MSFVAHKHVFGTENTIADNLSRTICCNAYWLVYKKALPSTVSRCLFGELLCMFRMLRVQPDHGQHCVISWCLGFGCSRA